jgi:hypothetical protein
MKLEFCRQIFEKHLKIKFHQNPPSESRGGPYGQTDGQDEANSRFLRTRLKMHILKYDKV